MKRLFVFMFATALTHPAQAFWGVGDITFDPQNYAQLSKSIEQAKQLYQTAKDQLDGLAKIEKTINDAQTAVDTLGSFNLKSAAQGLTGNTNNIKTAAQLRAALANTAGGLNQSAAYIQYQLNQIEQLDNLSKLQKAQADNAVQAATGKPNSATSAAISAQAAAATAALAAATEQRRVQEDIARAASAKAQIDNLNDSTKVYEAMGK